MASEINYRDAVLERSDAEVTGVPRPQPTRQQPVRDRDQPRRFVFHVSQLGTDANDGLVPIGLQELRRSIKAKSSAVVAATTDPFVYSLPVSGFQLWAALPG